MGGDGDGDNGVPGYQRAVSLLQKHDRRTPEFLVVDERNPEVVRWVVSENGEKGWKRWKMRLQLRILPRGVSSTIPYD